ncbi:MAG: hypothetical protein WAW63_02560 [Candidatus Saccharimonadales bacterium]
MVTERTVPRYGEWYVSHAGKKEVYFFFPSSEKRGEANVLEGKHVQEPTKPAVRPASLGGRLAGAKFVSERDAAYATAHQGRLHMNHKTTCVSRSKSGMIPA